MLILVYTLFIGLLVPSSARCSPIPHASSLVSQGVIAACSAAPLALVLLVVQLNAVSACPLLWAFAASFIQVNVANYAGIVCLCSVCWDSMSSFPNL